MGQCGKDMTRFTHLFIPNILSLLRLALALAFPFTPSGWWIHLIAAALVPFSS